MSRCAPYPEKNISFNVKIYDWRQVISTSFIANKCAGGGAGLLVPQNPNAGQKKV